MKSTSLFIVILLVFGLANAGCQTEEGALNAPPVKATEARIELEGVVAGECKDNQTLWELNGEQWLRRCLDAPLPRDTAVWVSDGERLVGLGPQGCSSQPEALSMHEVLGESVRETETGETSFIVTRASGGAFDSEGALHIFSNERCEYNVNFAVHLTIEKDGAHSVQDLWPHEAWPVVFARAEKVLVSGGLQLREGKLDISTAGGIELQDQPLCWVLSPHKTRGNWHFPYFCGRGRKDYVPEALEKGTWFDRIPQKGEQAILPPGRELTWVYDPKNDRLVSLGFFEPNMWKSSEMDPTPLKWRVDEGAWAIPKAGAPYALPKPPVVGDGITLLWHPELEQVILLDPFGEKSWLLSEEGEAAEWVVWAEHAPLAVPEGRELPANTQGLKHRYTQWWAPYFAYWDKEKGCPVVVFYDDPHSLCLPVEGLEDTYACPKAHS